MGYSDLHALLSLFYEGRLVAASIAARLAPVRQPRSRPTRARPRSGCFSRSARRPSRTSPCGARRRLDAPAAGHLGAAAGPHDPPSRDALRRRLAAAIELTLDAATRGATVSRSRRRLRTARPKARSSRRGAVTRKTDPVAPDTLVLPNLFFGSYEALAMRLASVPDGGSFKVYVAPQAEITVKQNARSTQTHRDGQARHRRPDLRADVPESRHAARRDRLDRRDRAPAAVRGRRRSRCSSSAKTSRRSPRARWSMSRAGDQTRHASRPTASTWPAR